MRLAVISDVHACMEALESVLADLDALGADELVCLGDMVGYGPEPEEVVTLLRERGALAVMGNHDAGVAGTQSLGMFREPNRRLLEVTQGLLSESNMAWLRGLPMVLRGEGWLAAHSSPIEPGRWAYMDSAMVCQRVLKAIDPEVRFCLIGHTHRAGVVAESFGVFSVKPGHRYMLNPGCLFHRRSEERRATYFILDTEKSELVQRAVPYEMTRGWEAYARLGFSREEARILSNLS